MKEVFEVATAIIVSVGGGAAVVWGLSSWLGKIWANRILENEKKEHSKELEEYRSQLQQQMNLLNSTIDKSVYVARLQHEKELEIFQEIWDKFVICVMGANNLFPKFERRPAGGDELEKFIDKKWDKFAEAYINFSVAVDKYAPFYEESIFIMFVEARQLFYEQGEIFHFNNYVAPEMKMTIEDRKKAYTTIPKEIERIQVSIQKSIKDHIKNLQSVNT